MRTGNFRGFEVTGQDPGIAIITFNQPERLNGMTHHLKRDLVETLIQAQMDDAVRVVVFTGSGRAFSAGDDITGRPVGKNAEQALVPNIPAGHHNPTGTYNGLRHLSQPLNQAVRNLDKIAIAAIKEVISEVTTKPPNAIDRRDRTACLTVNAIRIANAG